MRSEYYEIMEYDQESNGQMANPDPTLEQEIGLAVHKAFQKHANRGWVRGGDKLSELMSDVAKSISPIFESHLNRAVVEAERQMASKTLSNNYRRVSDE